MDTAQLSNSWVVIDTFIGKKTLVLPEDLPKIKPQRDKQIQYSWFTGEFKIMGTLIDFMPINGVEASKESL